MYEFGTEEQDAAVEVLRSRRLFRYMDGAHHADDFERELAARMGVGHTLLTSSGTAALVCALGAVGVGPGDEVLIPSYGFVADPLAVLAIGAVPVVCDVDESLTMDPDDLGRRLTERTRAVVPVHMNGFVADLAPILAFAKQHGLAVVEDACQAIGATYRGKPVGTHGDVGAFSFNQAKVITAGEGGAVLTDDAELLERAFILHDPTCVFDGRPIKQPVFGGYAFRATELTAAIMRVQLGRLDGILARLRANRDRVHAAVQAGRKARHIPLNDEHGACGNHVAYVLDSREEAEDVLRRARTVDAEGFYATQGIANGHSFFEWDVLHGRRGGHTPRANPLADAPYVQGPDDCAASRDVLERIVLIGFGTELPDRALDELSAALGG
jgi:dTDP-4-amino-4,6-dideoxygalactose transaminase